jgi:hypothetical protein
LDKLDGKKSRFAPEGNNVRVIATNQKFDSNQEVKQIFNKNKSKTLEFDSPSQKNDQKVEQNIEEQEIESEENDEVWQLEQKLISTFKIPKKSNYDS